MPAPAEGFQRFQRFQGFQRFQRFQRFRGVLRVYGFTRFGLVGAVRLTLRWLTGDSR